ncbi:MAG: hypothetical protein A3B37_03185 [Candidatus Sungbacteria bacterium RIFCSPLOWO2_01_FULL_59_16]|uniref:Uncharacterized protein n=1 Tax=Candidatus Sungbacteria bacterium RIFCSPLOWO2_01_FULL_59_16 TaxID=1802280 RepID=A0A1G2LBI9_9BACT|nr:MAG: hypothetical protein A3B37_03185 [Candidatus Sungbacteria bacterium RIFCSPLOWO2_01_FULL_59_16]
MHEQKRELHSRAKQRYKMPMKADRGREGLVQVSILIAIIIGAAILGGGYFAYQRVKLSKNNKTQTKEL